MRPPDEEKAAFEHEMQQAETALVAGRYDSAQHHAEEAARLGAHGHDVVRLEKAISAKRRAQEQRARSGGCIGFLIAGAGYLILSARQPTAWGVAIWAALALLLVPAVAGFGVGRRQGVVRSSGRRFRTALAAVGPAMFIYTAFSLAVLRSRMGTGTARQVLPVILFASAAYAIVAGLVAGVVSGMLAVRRAREDAP